MNKLVQIVLVVLVLGLTHFLGQQSRSIQHETGAEHLEQKIIAQMDALSIELNTLRGSYEKLERHIKANSNRTYNDAATQNQITEVLSRLEHLESQADNRPIDSDLASKMKSRSTEIDRMPFKREISLYRSAIRDQYENDNNAAVERKVALEEDAELVFDNDDLDQLEFGRMDCKERFCQLQYADFSTSKTEASITENILLLKLSDHYGEDVTFHFGKSDGDSRSLYIEFPQGKS